MILLKNVSKSYGPNAVLKGVSLSVSKGEVVALIGPSGSGKTTLLRCMNLLTVPDTGMVTIDGQALGSQAGDGRFVPVPAARIAARRAHLGMVYQRFNLFPHMTALENVMLAPVLVLKMPRPEARQLALRQLEKVGLRDKVDSYPAKLSGGQQQRVAIARALAMAPRVMLFDEPTSALDPELVGEVLEAVRRLADEGMTMVIVTHEMEFARVVADRIVVLHDGQILEEGPPGVIFSNPRHERTRTFLRRALHSMQPGSQPSAPDDNLTRYEGSLS